MISKGTRLREPVPASPRAFIHLAHYLDEGSRRRAGEPVWRTLRGPDRPLSYWALRRVLQRANDLLGANWSWHDCRHTAAARMAAGEELTLPEVQAIMRHASIQTTSRYLAVRVEELFDKLTQHYNLPKAAASYPAGYSADDIAAVSAPAVPGERDHGAPHYRPQQAARPGRRGARLPEPLPRAETRTEPAVATAPPRPHGDLSRAPVSLLAGLARDTWEADEATVRQRAQGAQVILEYLRDFPGGTWQQRWDASPLGRGEIPASALGSRRTTGAGRAGLRSLFCMRALQPSNLAFRVNAFQGYSGFFVQAQRDPLLDKFAEHARSLGTSWRARHDAVSELCSLLTIQGVAIADVTPGALLHHAHETRSVRAAMPDVTMSRPAASSAAPRGTCCTRWSVPAGHAADDAGRAEQGAAAGRGARRPLSHPQPGSPPAAYRLLPRGADLDYASLKTLILTLACHFWEKIEAASPGQADLRISPETYEAWRHSIRLKADGSERRHQEEIVLNVRSFYYDLHTWAAGEPELWARWVAPCQVPPGEFRGLGARRRRVNERSAERTRQRQPLLPLLVKYAEDRYDHTRVMLEQARDAAEGESFTVDGATYQRVITASDRKTAHRGALPVRLLNQATGDVINAAAEEETAFWDWACVETLRRSGIRIEELSELTHLSVRQCRRKNGEVIALLVIAPSKTDRERVIPMSAELFHVIASIVRRHTQGGKPIPQVSRYDNHDKVWSPPMPFLFQRPAGTTRRCSPRLPSPGGWNAAGRRCPASTPRSRPSSFRPHDSAGSSPRSW